METMRPFDDKAPIGWEVSRFMQVESQKLADLHLPYNLEVQLGRALGHERRLVNDLADAARKALSAFAVIEDSGRLLRSVVTENRERLGAAIRKLEGAEPVPAADPDCEWICCPNCRCGPEDEPCGCECHEGRLMGVDEKYRDYHCKPGVWRKRGPTHAEFIELAGTDEGESAELLPCPFCGPGESRVSLWHDDVAKRWRVGCGRCGASTGTSPRDKGQAVAVAAWNRRGAEPESPITAAEVEAVEAALKARGPWVINHQEEIDSAVAESAGAYVGGVWNPRAALESVDDERDDLRAGAEVRAALKARGL